MSVLEHGLWDAAMKRGVYVPADSLMAEAAGWTHTARRADVSASLMSELLF